MQGKIVVGFRGGLGNQLFQYATALAAAERTGAALILDCASGFFLDPYERNFELAALVNGEPRLRAGNVLGCLAVRAGLRLLSARQPTALLPGWTLLEDEAGWQQSLDRALSRGGNVYLRGYWQDHRFFGNWGAELGRRLQKAIHARQSGWNAFEPLPGTGVLSVHVRGLPGASASGKQVSGLTPVAPAFYDHALDAVQARMNVKRALVFSDGGHTGSVLRMIEARSIDVVPVQGLQSTEDLYLMSRCHAHICGQSTFSWWGAFLAGEISRLVVWPGSGGKAPEPAIPASWQVLPDGASR
jgi:hypothetical protein